MLKRSHSIKAREGALLDEDSKNLTEEKTSENTAESIQSEVKLIESEKPMKLFRAKPNFFLAIQVNNVGIHLKVKELQEKLILKNPSLFPALIKVSTLHVTLAVTYLANKTNIETIKSKLDEWAEKNVKVFFEQPCTLTFYGVNTFSGVVAYVDVEKDSNYKNISEISSSLNNLLSSNGFSVSQRSFKPHLTFLNLRKDFKLNKLKKNFKGDMELLKNSKEYFGKQEVTSLQLLSMDDPKDEAGYYNCYYCIKVLDTELNMDHSTCCSPILSPKSLTEENQQIFNNVKNDKKK